MHDARLNGIHFDGETPARAGDIAALVGHIRAYGVNAVSHAGGRRPTREGSTLEVVGPATRLNAGSTTRIEKLLMPDKSSVAETVTRGCAERIIAVRSLCRR